MTGQRAAAISEHQLIDMLVGGGRKVCIADLANWRKNGLLPPLASHGVGAARGKTYGWHEPDIVARAERIHDAFRQYGRNDMVLLTLFLSGFAVPLPQLRRAWAFRCKLRKPPAIRPMPPTAWPSAAPVGDPLLQAAIAIGAAVETDHHLRMRPLLERALAKLGYPKPAANALLLRVLMTMEAALDGSDLVHAAPDDDIRRAQRHLMLAMDFLRSCAADEEQGSLAAIFGPSLFAFILVLLRSGQGAILDRAAAKIETAARPPAARKVSRVVHAPASVRAHRRAVPASGRAAL